MKKDKTRTCTKCSSFNFYKRITLPENTVKLYSFKSCLNNRHFKNFLLLFINSLPLNYLHFLCGTTVRRLTLIIRKNGRILVIDIGD